MRNEIKVSLIELQRTRMYVTYVCEINIFKTILIGNVWVKITQKNVREERRESKTL